MWNDFLDYVLIGFVAQLIDGAFGMAYGVISSSLLLSFGIPPAVTSATVHTSECFTTGASALSHHAFGNIDHFLFWKLLLPGIIGAIFGATILSSIDGQQFRPWIAGYLMILGILIVFKAFHPSQSKTVTTHIPLLGFVGATLDALGGGGWGSIVVSNLVSRGHDPRFTIGSVNTVEFFVTLAASITFFFTLGTIHLDIILGLAAGGMLSAPLGAYLSKRLPTRPFMAFVGLLIILVSLKNLLYG